MSVFNSGMLYRVVAPYFAAGLVVAQDGVIIEAAPILRKYVNTSFASFKGHCRWHGWTLEPVKTYEEIDHVRKQRR